MQRVEVTLLYYGASSFFVVVQMRRRVNVKDSQQRSNQHSPKKIERIPKSV